MPTDRDYLIAAIMGEAQNQDDLGMAMVADVLTNRMMSKNPFQYGTPAQGTASSYQGQLFAYTKDEEGNKVPQLSSANLDQAKKEAKTAGTPASYRVLMKSIFEPGALLGEERSAYERASRIADAFVDPNNPNFNTYRGVARGSDFFDTGKGWAGKTEWGQANVFKHGGHFFRSQQPL